MGAELVDTESRPESASGGSFSKADAVDLGILVEMAYTMAGQGLNPPIPSGFPSDRYAVIANVTMKDSVTGSGGTREFYGFIAHSKAVGTNDYVMAIRGTIGVVEWIVDLRSIYAVPFHAYGKVGSGFADTYATLHVSDRDAAATHSAALMDADAAARPFAAQVADVIAKHAAEVGTAALNLPPPRLALTGHSLGSALITLYAVHRLAWSTVPLSKCYTFASPLVGDQSFANAFNALDIGQSYRIFDNWDPIPDLPAFVGFVPVNTAYPIDLSPSLPYPFNPKCSHSLDTYLNHFDPSYPPATACNTLFSDASFAAARPSLTAVERTLVSPSDRSPTAQAPAEGTTHTTSISHGQTTVTITVRTSGG